MARLKFRATRISLNEEEDVSEVTALVDIDAYGLITDILGPVHTTVTARGGTEMTVTLPVADALTLWRACGSMNGLDPRYDKGSHDIWESLSRIVYGLIEED